MTRHPKYPDEMLDWLRRRQAVVFIGSDLGPLSGYPNDPESARQLLFRLKLNGTKSSLAEAVAMAGRKVGRDAVARELAGIEDTAAGEAFFDPLADLYGLTEIITTALGSGPALAAQAMGRPMISRYSEYGDSSEPPSPDGFRLWYLCRGREEPDPELLTVEGVNRCLNKAPDFREDLGSLLLHRPLISVGFDPSCERDRFFHEFYTGITDSGIDDAGSPPPLFVIDLEEASGWPATPAPKARVTMPRDGWARQLQHAVGKDTFRKLAAADKPLSNVPDTHHFIGRHSELEHLEKQMNSCNILILEGLPGVGKSMLAARLARRVRARFNDRVLWVPLGGLEVENLKKSGYVYFDSILAELAAYLAERGDRELEQIRLDPNARLRAKIDALIASLTRLSCLVVIDDFHVILGRGNGIREKNIKDLLEALAQARFNTRVLITSRYTPKIPDDLVGLYRNGTVTGLSQREGADLLAQLGLDVTGRNRKRVAAKLGGHPKALKIFCPLAERFPLDDLLQADLLGEQCVDRLLEKLYEEVLEDRQRSLLLFSSVFRRPVGYAGLRAMGLDDRGITALLDFHLLDLDRIQQTYNQHPIVRTFAYRRLVERGDARLAESHKRAAGYYEERLSGKQRPTLERIELFLERHYHLRQTDDWARTIETAIKSFDELKILADAYREAANMEGAEKAYEAALDMDPIDAASNYWYAVLLEGRNVEFEKVNQHFKIALERDYQVPYILGYAKFLVGRNRLVWARRELDHALRVRSKDYRLYKYYGKLEEKNGEIERALAVYERGITAFPKIGTYALKAAELLRKHPREGDASRIRHFYEQAIAANLGDPSPVLEYGAYLKIEGNLEEAERVFAAGFRENPGSNHIVLAYSDFLERAENKEKAGKVLSTGYEKSPGNPDIVLAYADFLERAGNKERAERVLSTGFENSPGRHHIVLAYAAFLESAGKKEQAGRVLSTGYEKSPGNPDIVLAHADFLERAGKKERAERVLSTGFENSPGSHHIVLAYSDFLERAGNKEKAGKVLSTGFEKNSCAHGIVLAFADFLERTGKDEKAYRVLAKGYEKSPCSHEIALAYADFLERNGTISGVLRWEELLVEASENQELSTNPIFQGYLLNAATRSSMSNLRTKGISLANAWLAGDENHVPSLCFMAWLDQRQNKPEAAETKLIRALKAKKNQILAHEKYSGFLISQNRLEDAREILDAGLALHPQNEYLLTRMQELERALENSTPSEKEAPTPRPQLEDRASATDSHRHQKSESEAVDVLVVMALWDELKALLACLPKDVQPSSRFSAQGFPYQLIRLQTASGRHLSLAAVHAPEMGETAMATHCSLLTKELSPRVLAMTGICAGNKQETFLGDICVADRVFKVDGGKKVTHQRNLEDITIEDEAHYQDIRTYNLKPVWKTLIEDLPDSWKDRIGLPRPKSFAYQERWLLHTVHGGKNPLNDPDRQDHCPQMDRVVDRLLERGLLCSDGIALTEEGKKAVMPSPWHQHRPIEQDPISPRVHIGPVGTLSYVCQDPNLFPRLKWHSRKMIGIEMEGAAMGAVAEIHDLPMILVKGVADYGDHDKDDGFRHFAARAAAAFLLHFLLETPAIQGDAN